MRQPYKLIIRQTITNSQQLIKKGIKRGSYLEVKIKEVDLRSRKPVEPLTTFYGFVAELRNSSLILTTGVRGRVFPHPEYGFVPTKSSKSRHEQSKGNEIKYSSIAQIAIVKGITQIPEYEPPNAHVRVDGF
jgi:hypothetical protein